MRALSLFAGIGGFDLAIERLGGQTVGFVEIDPFCQEVLRKHWPEVPIHDDIKTFSGAAFLGGVDLVVGGPPCQPASLAGKRQGASDSRWLWGDFLRVVREVRPRFVVAENPPGIITLEPLGLDWILASLEEAGYQCEALVVGAWAVGAPHKRDRVWILAHSNGAGLREPREGDAGSERDTGRDTASAGGSGVADTAEPRRDGRSRSGLRGDGQPLQAARSSERGAGAMADTDGGRREGERDEATRTRREPQLAGAFGNEPDRRDGASLADTSPGGRGELRGRSQAARDADEQREGLGDAKHADGRPDEPGRLEEGRVAPGRSGAERLADPRSERRQEPRSRHTGPPTATAAPSGTARWPARPGEPQHEWEEPRLVAYTESHLQQPLRGSARRDQGEGSVEAQGGPLREGLRRPDDGRPADPGAGQEQGQPEQPVGGATAGLPGRLVRLARRNNREALKAVGNSVCPQVAEAVLRAMMESEESR